jgi:hypothetical protein
MPCELMNAKWVDINGNEKTAPIYVASLEEAVNYYNSVYDENQTHSLPDTIGLPQNILSNRRACLLLSAASERASKRTRDMLVEETKLRNKQNCLLL